MKFTWTGTVWTVAAKDEPTRPWIAGGETALSQTYNITGDYRLHYNFDKKTFTFSWPAATDATDLNIRSMINNGLSVKFESMLGTYYIVMDPNSYTCQCSGYNSNILSVSGREV